MNSITTRTLVSAVLGLVVGGIVAWAILRPETRADQVTFDRSDDAGPYTLKVYEQKVDGDDLISGCGDDPVDLEYDFEDDESWATAAASLASDVHVALVCDEEEPPDQFRLTVKDFVEGGDLKVTTCTVKVKSHSGQQVMVTDKDGNDLTLNFGSMDSARKVASVLHRTHDVPAKTCLVPSETDLTVTLDLP